LIFVFTPAARRDIERLREFLMPISQTAAARATTEILKAIRSLDHFRIGVGHLSPRAHAN
jgi:plasmid stabilization system protein ParE